MRSKLVLVFDEDNEIMNVPKALIFNNALDAERYLLSIENVTCISIEPDSCYFTLKCIWRHIGRAYWATEPY